mmetsp:Transcript_15179/g.47374  ORF Transcript_15179/g.47374 Transcript_15179/m.47374 type:complete len:309 (+) Transcript_15179:423-1349(+)
MALPNATLVIALFGVIVGFAIGTVGVGGVVVVPVLVALLPPSLAVQAIVASALASYTAAGVIAVARVALLPSHASAHLSAARLSLPLCLALAGVGASLGIWLLTLLSGPVVLVVLYSFMWLTSAAALVQLVYNLTSDRRTKRRQRAPRTGSRGGRRRRLARRRHAHDDANNDANASVAATPAAFHARLVVTAPLLLATGCLSALTGTSGPVTGIPLMLLAGFPASLALLLAQTVQLPIAALATIAVAVVDSSWLLPQLAVPLALGQAVGVLIGMPLSSRLPATRLRVVLTSVLLVAATVLLVRTFVAA